MSEWISVNDRLPEIQDPVIVYSKDYGKWEEYQRTVPARRVMVNDKDWSWFELDHSNTMLLEVTHWRCLLEPPKL